MMGQGESGKVKWKNSEARSLLYKDVKNGAIDNVTWDQVFDAQFCVMSIEVCNIIGHSSHRHWGRSRTELR